VELGLEVVIRQRGYLIQQQLPRSNSCFGDPHYSLRMQRCKVCTAYFKQHIVTCPFIILRTCLGLQPRTRYQIFRSSEICHELREEYALAETIKQPRGRQAASADAGQFISLCRGDGGFYRWKIRSTRDSDLLIRISRLVLRHQNLRVITERD